MISNMKGSGFFGIFRGAWWILYWSIGAIFAVFVVAVVIDLAHMPQKTADAVTAIHAQRLTMADVDGKHLPPAPDPKLADATVEGIDANKNGIRDDVELAIFKKYPSDTKIRAAELQYAMELQQELSGKIFNSETWKANAIAEDRGYQCIAGTFPRENIQQHIKNTSSKTSEVESLVFNTEQRKSARNDVNKYETSLSLPTGDFCDISAKTK